MGGTCVCSEGTKECGGECVNLKEDASNCGACGVTCATGEICSSGSCEATTVSQGIGGNGTGGAGPGGTDGGGAGTGGTSVAGGTGGTTDLDPDTAQQQALQAIQMTNGLTSGVHDLARGDFSSLSQDLGLPANTNFRNDEEESGAELGLSTNSGAAAVAKPSDNQCYDTGIEVDWGNLLEFHGFVSHGTYWGKDEQRDRDVFRFVVQFLYEGDPILA